MSCMLFNYKMFYKISLKNILVDKDGKNYIFYKEFLDNFLKESNPLSMIKMIH